MKNRAPSRSGPDLPVRRALAVALSLLGAVTLFAQSDVTQPGDPVVGSSANTPAAETPDKAIDDQASTKYLNFDKVNTGFTVTPAKLSLVTGLAITSANDGPERDPASYHLEGSLDGGGSWATISSNALSAFTTRFQRQVISFANDVSYTSYRITFPTIANEAAANSMQVAEVEFLGVAYTAGPAVVTLQPVGATVREGQTATFSIEADGTPYLTYQWFLGSDPIDGATNASYTTPPATADMDGNSYTVTVTNPLGSDTSDAAVLTVNTAPAVLAASSRGHPAGVFVLYTEDMDPTTALNANNYVIDGTEGLAVTNVVFAPVVALNGPQSAVLLETSLPLVGGTLYNVTIFDVTDPSAETIDPNPGVVSFTHNAGVVCYDFESGVPAGTSAYGTAMVDSGIMKITLPLEGQNGSWIVNDVNSGAPITRFVATWDALVGGGTATPADGYSFSVASDLPAAGFGEEGAGSGLTIAIDNYDNGGGEAPAIDIKWNNSVISHNLTTVQRSGAEFFPVMVKLDPDGTLDVTYNNTVIVENLQTPYTPIANAKFGWGARTGGLWDNHWIDNVCIELYTAGPVQLVSQPGDTLVNEGETVSWSLVADGTPPYFVQWYSNSVAIPGATSLTYEFMPLRYADGAVYSATISNEFSGLVTADITLNVNSDSEPPAALSAHGDPIPNRALVVFSEEVEEASAENIANYSLVSGPSVTNATLLDSLNVVLVEFDAALTPNTAYELNVSGVRDVSAVNNEMAATSLTFTAPICAEGVVLFRQYLNLSGPNNLGTLTNNARFPNAADIGRLTNSATWPQTAPDIGNYGIQVKGYVIAPETGTYHFDLLSDDSSLVLLGTDSRAESARVAVREDACCAVRTGGPIELQAGVAYYFEGLMQEGGGGDHFRVRAELPSTPGVFSEIPSALMGYCIPKLEIVDQPVSQTTLENRFVNFSVVTDQGADLHDGVVPAVQWQRSDDGVTFTDIPGANLLTYTEFAEQVDDGVQFRAVVTFGSVTLTSDAATLTVETDAVPPQVASVTLDGSLRKIYLTFNELVNVTAAEEEINYTLTDPSMAQIMVSSAVLNNGNSVVLTLASAMAPATAYNLQIVGVSDLAGNVIAGDPINGTNVAVLTWSVAHGFVQYDFWLGIGGGTVNDLLNSPRYPIDSGNHVTYITNTVNWPQTSPDLNDYALRMSGYFVPSESGSHTFFIRHDDDARMQLSTDESPANLVTIFEMACCNGDTPPTRASSPVDLVAGQRYYFEAIVKEAGGGDYLGIAVRGPSDTQTRFIQPANLAMVVAPEAGPTGAFAQQPSSVTIEENHTATFSVVFTNSGALPAHLQWQRQGPGEGSFTDIPGATGNSYTTPFLTLADDGTQYRAIANLPGNPVASDAATVTVVADTTLPTVVSVGSANGTQVGVRFDEQVDALSAEEEVNYSVGGVNPDSAVLRADGSSVQLVFSGSVPAEFTVSIENVADVAGNVVAATNLSSRVWLETVVDINAPEPAGTHFSEAEGVIEISAGGNDVWGTSDQFTYAYETRTGDFDVQVRVDSLEFVGNNWTKAGLNIRESTAPDSRMVWIYPTPLQGSAQFEGAIRFDNGADVVDFGQPRPAVFFPAWLRVARVGTQFSAYLSNDGTNWTQFGTTQDAPQFPETLLVGLGVVSHIQGTPATARFSEYGDVPPTSAGALAIERDGDQIVITWEGPGVLEYTDNLTDPVTWTPLPEATSGYSAPADQPQRYYRLSLP